MAAGGTDTVSNTLYWIFAFLCNYPDVQKTAATEIDNFVKLNGRIPKFTERDRFPYLTSLIKECMRIRPTTAFGAPHQAEEDSKYKLLVSRYKKSILIFEIMA